MNPKRIAILGAGGREHALALHFLSSEHVAIVHVVPGNAGMNFSQGLQTWTDWDQQVQSLQQYIQQHNIDWVYVSPDSYLAQGWVDQLATLGIKAFGPTQKAARIESSKAYAKECMQKALIPTAQFIQLQTDHLIEAHLQNPLFKSGVVIKADGLAAGKGVEIFEDPKLALIAARHWLKMGPILLEERLQGPEVSSFFMCDGDQFIYLGSACDHKRRFDGDQGPNTGGMGAYAYQPEDEEGWINYLGSQIVTPLLKTMHDEGNSFSGVLFIGLMLTVSGIKVLEFNARWGDPETQCLLPLINENLFDYCEAIVNKKFKPLKKSIFRKSMASVHVVKVNLEYPGPHKQKNPIYGLEKELPKNTFFYSSGIGTSEGVLVNSGGRVFGITALADSTSLASALAYQTLDLINFAGADFRKDIGCPKP